MAYSNREKGSITSSSISGKNWGSKIIPKEEWIDTGKRYTSEGYEVINIIIDLGDDPKREPTYPVSGVLVGRPNGTGSMMRGRWTLDGRIDICFEQDRRNLKEIK